MDGCGSHCQDEGSCELGDRQEGAFEVWDGVKIVSSAYLLCIIPRLPCIHGCPCTAHNALAHSIRYATIVTSCRSTLPLSLSISMYGVRPQDLDTASAHSSCPRASTRGKRSHRQSARQCCTSKGSPEWHSWQEANQGSFAPPAPIPFVALVASGRQLSTLRRSPPRAGGHQAD